MRRPAALLLLAGLAALPLGCLSSRSDLVEAELRVKDRNLQDLRSELERTDAYNQYLQRELRHLQQCVVPGPTPESPISAAAVRTIQLGRQTGGVEQDGVPGDEALQVVIEPRDADNHVVKAPGIAEVIALEVLTEGVKKPLSSWVITSDELRHTWRTGLLSTGYHLTLAWKNWPTTNKIRVVVRFVTEDQRQFEADKDVTIRQVPASMRKMLPPDPPPPLMPKAADGTPQTPKDPEIPPPPKEIELPLPRKLEPDLPKEVKPEEGPKLEDSATSAKPDADRPMKGAVELLKPVALEEPSDQ